MYFIAAVAIALAPGFVPVQRSQGLYDHVVLSPSSASVTIAPRLSRGGGRLALVGGSPAVQPVPLPRCGQCGSFGGRCCADWESHTILHADSIELSASRHGNSAALWTHRLDAMVQDLVVADGLIHVLQGPEWSKPPESLLALTGEGTVAWQIQPPDNTHHRVTTTATELLLATPEGVQVVQASDGALLPFIPIPGAEVQYAHANDSTLVAVRGERGDELVGFDRSSSRVSWRVPIEPTELPQVVGDFAVVCTKGGRVAAYSLADGSPAWSYGLGFECLEILAVPVAAAMPARMLVAGKSGEILAFAAVTEAAKSEQYTMRGRILGDGKPLAGVVVHVGDQSVRTHRNGRYRARGHGRGAVKVWVELPDLDPTRPDFFDRAQPSFVQLSGKHAYWSHLRATRVIEDCH